MRLLFSLARGDDRTIVVMGENAMQTSTTRFEAPIIHRIPVQLVTTSPWRRVFSGDTNGTPSRDQLTRKPSISRVSEPITCLDIITPARLQLQAAFRPTAHELQDSVTDLQVEFMGLHHRGKRARGLQYSQRSWIAYFAVLDSFSTMRLHSCKDNGIHVGGLLCLWFSQTFYRCHCGPTVFAVVETHHVVYWRVHIPWLLLISTLRLPRSSITMD
jgi:hypothetical protein